MHSRRSPIRNRKGRKRQSLIAWRKVIKKIARKGFLKEADIPKSFVRRLTDPIFVNPPAMVCKLTGVSHPNGGRRKFSTFDLLGRRVYRTQYIVVNDSKFRRLASAMMEADFRAKNPHPDRVITAAFTPYMHESNLHWSGCRERQREVVS